MYSNSVAHDVANDPSRININGVNTVISSISLHGISVRVTVNNESEKIH
jgi:hypothetical protein